MSKTDHPAVVLRFSFDEHDWLGDCEEPEQATARMLERARSAPWTPIESGDAAWLDPSCRTLEALRTALEEALMEELQQSVEVVDALFESLKLAIAGRGPLSRADRRYFGAWCYEEAQTEEPVCPNWARTVL